MKKIINILDIWLYQNKFIPEKEELLVIENNSINKKYFKKQF